MGLLAEAFHPRPRASTPGVTSDFWYARDPSGFLMEASGAGLALGADTILRCGTVLAAVSFRANAWAMCPPKTIRETDTGHVKDPGHYSQLVLENPNAYQTGFRWRQLNGAWMALWGNAYNEIVPGRRAFVEELRPLHPSHTRVKEQRDDGALIYEHSPPGRAPRELGQERVLHFREISTDGISGLEIFRLIRNVVGIALLAEQHAAAFLRKGARVAGLLSPSAPLDAEKRKELREAVNQDLGGSGNTGTLGVLPHGVELKPLASTNRESQFLELSDQMVGMILRALRVPGVVVGWMGDKTATYASAKEFFESGGIVHTMQPILTNVEDEEKKSLLVRGDGRQIRHRMDVLLRANTKDRVDSLVKAIGGPFMSVNEGRRIEDLNPDPDPRHDKILTPGNMSPELLGPDPEPDPPPPPPRRPSAPPEDEEQARRPRQAPAASDPRDALLRHYAEEHARALVSYEVGQIRARAPRLARSKDGWRAFVLELYGGHAEHVARKMRIPEEAARAYCDRQAQALLTGGAAAAETWELEMPPKLAAMALEAK